MNNLAPMLAYSAGSITLGVALTMYLLLVSTRRSGNMEGSEGCFATFILLVVLSIAAGFFGLAVHL